MQVSGIQHQATMELAESGVEATAASIRSQWPATCCSSKCSSPSHYTLGPAAQVPRLHGSGQHDPRAEPAPGPQFTWLQPTLLPLPASHLRPALHPKGCAGSREGPAPLLPSVTPPKHFLPLSLVQIQQMSQIKPGRHDFLSFAFQL